MGVCEVSQFFLQKLCASFGHGKPLGERITRAKAVLFSAAHRPVILVVASP
jgi:hypothetical protein